MSVFTKVVTIWKLIDLKSKKLRLNHKREIADLDPQGELDLPTEIGHQHNLGDLENIGHQNAQRIDQDHQQK